MTTRDPRSRDSIPPFAGRDPTQSLSIDPSEAAAAMDPDEEPTAGSVAHPSLALGTHEARQHGDERTRVESPAAAARSKTPEPPRPPSAKPPPIPPRHEPVEHRLGEVLGSYRILEQLGKGGMGYVFRAEHIKLGREVALKLLRSDYARRRDAVARFFQEARTVNRVRHRNIVDVTDFVELDDGTTFIIMELLSGQSLGKWARSGVDLPRALAVLVQICDGLGAAHQVGVIHRDLKPDNIIVVPTSDGAELVKLLDFGVAKLLNHGDEDIGFQTAAGSVIGTPAYMSPEQAGGMVVDARSDIYSLGAIMYELFTGQPMFRGRSFGEYVRKHLTEMPVPPRATKGGGTLDPRLEAIILRALEKDPNQRFSSIQELRDALLGMLGGMETHPPSFVSMTASGIAPPQVPMIPHAMATVLPMTAPQLPISGPHASPASGLYPGYYSQFASQIAPPPPPATPWYVWFVGGAIAVGLGVAAALWYAGGDDPAVKQAAQLPITPPPQPIVTPSEPPKPEPIELLELQFDSLPSGGVYADGRSAELCRTPCTFNVDLRDGGPKDRRTFVVRAEGYKDASVVVDLAAPKRDFKVTLEQLEPPTPVVDDKPVRSTKPTKRPVKQQVTTTKPADKPADKPTETAPKGDPDKLEDPTDGKPVVKPVKPTKTTIDPTDLADPFKKQRKR